MDGKRNAAGRLRRSPRPNRPAVEALDARQLLSGFGGQQGVGSLGHSAFLQRAQAIVGLQQTSHHEGVGAVDSPGTSRPEGASHAPAGGGRVISNITYTTAGMPAEHLDLYLPGGTAPAGGWPVILAFGGGGWRWTSRQQYGQEVAALTKDGFAVAGVDYAYASNSPNGSHSWPSDLIDAQQAVRWAREHASGLHLNPDEIVAMGDSAGANLALLLGTYPSGPVQTDSPPSGPSADSNPVSAKVQAVVSFYGPTDLTTLYNESRPQVLPYFDTYLGGPPGEYPGRYTAASPITYVNSGDPPILMVQGLQDRTDLPSQSYEMDSALSKAGVPHQLITISWATHGFGLDLVGYNLTGDVANFLDAALKGEPIPETVANP